jgi:predicted Zn finger-like uncharacterized protein
MALATKCPHCNTIFRVAHDQLKLRGGIVRCGSCNEVFDGNAALVVPNALPAEPLAVSIPAPLPAPAPLEDKLAALDTRAAAELHGEAEEPIYTLELDSVEPAAEPEPAAFEPPAQHEEPSATSAAVADEEALDLDLDLNVDDEPEAAADAPATEPPAAAPAELLPDVAPPASEPEPALELELDVESMTDAELEAALAAELEAIAVTEAELAQEPAIAAPAPAPAPDFSAPEPESAEEAAPEPAFDLDATLPGDGRREPTFGEPPSEHLIAAAITDGQHGHEDDLLDEDEEAVVQLSSGGRERAEHDAGAASHTIAEAEDTDLAVADEALAAEEAPEAFEEPGFVKRDRRNQKLRKAATIAMSIGSVLLVGALFGQVITTFRNPLAAYVPALKQPLTQVCAVLGCKIELPTQIDYVTIEQGELQTLTETTFSFTTLLRNQSTTAQAWPHIELVLDDASDKAILRRVFTPRDYLPAGADLAQGFAPHTEQSVKLYFELGQLKASGYHIAVFYP